MFILIRVLRHTACTFLFADHSLPLNLDSELQKQEKILGVRLVIVFFPCFFVLFFLFACFFKKP